MGFVWNRGRRRSQFFRFALALASLLTPTLAAATPTATLVLSSEPGDYIGQGGEFQITYESPADTIHALVRRTLADGSPAELLFVLVDAPPLENFSTLFFGTDQLGIPIQTGTYVDAQRADTAALGHPGLDVSFQHRGCNTVSGSFSIDEVSFYTAPSGELSVASFAASFEQHCERSAPALYGTFSYSNPVVPEPGTVVLLFMGLTAMGFRLTSRCS